MKRRDDGDRRAAGPRWRRTPLVVVGMSIAALMLSACGGGSGGSSVASITSAQGDASESSPDPLSKASGLAFSRCMRSHGVSGFPDPDSSGDISISPGDGVNPQSPQFESAQRACQSLLPVIETTPAEESERQAEGLKLARCMRANGVPKFPDPVASGSDQVQSSVPEKPPFDPNSPAFKAATDACREYLGGGPGGGPTFNPGVPGE